MPWPGPNEMLFKSDIDCHNNACLNVGRMTLGRYAGYYRDAADLLVEDVIQRHAILDALIYPIVFLYRQYLELTLKEIIDTARQLEEHKSGFSHTHKIVPLWREAKRLLLQHYAGKLPKEVDYLDPCMEEFDKHDPQSFAFRYPVDKEGNPNLPGLNHINIRNLCDTMGRIASLLDGLATDLSVHLDLVHEQSHYY